MQRKEKEGVRYYSSPYGSTEGTCCKLRFTQFGFLDSSKKPGIAVVFFFIRLSYATLWDPL